MNPFPIIDDPKFPRSAENNTETFNIRWLNRNGRKNGTNRNKLSAANRIAENAKENGGTNIEIYRQWITGYLV